MADVFGYRITSTPFDEDYEPSASTRTTTNFANLARGEHRRANLRRALAMIDGRCDDLLGGRGRYTVQVEIVSVELCFTEGDGASFPLLEMLDLRILDRDGGEPCRGIVGNSLSSWVRDYDFSVLLPALDCVVPDGFGDLHGKLFRHLLASQAYRERFPQAPVVCLSVSTSRTYRRTGLHHRVLGCEYVPDRLSLTDDYFAKMGLGVRCFMPRGAVAPLAFYSRGEELESYTDLQLVGTIATMETFQRIYRPEIYGAHAPAADTYTPSLAHRDFTPAPIEYDRAERSRLGATQGRFTEEHFITPHRDVLEQWAAGYPSTAC